MIFFVMIERLFILLFIQLWAEITAQSSSQYSLQTAVEALHRNEMLGNLKNYNTRGIYKVSKGDDYWSDSDDNDINNEDNNDDDDDDNNNDDDATISVLEPDVDYSNMRRLSQILTKHMSRDFNNGKYFGGMQNELNDENFIQPINDGQESFFNERNKKFRGPYKQSDLIRDFLREVQKENKKKCDLKYESIMDNSNHQQKNDKVKQLLLDIENRKNEYLHLNPSIINKNDKINSYYNEQLMDKRKRERTPNNILQWLSAPKMDGGYLIKKRSSQKSLNDINVTGTDKKVIQDLQALFDYSSSTSQKKKRSFENFATTTTAKSVTDDSKHLNHNNNFKKNDDPRQKYDEDVHDDIEKPDEDEYSFDNDNNKDENQNENRFKLDIVEDNKISPDDVNRMRSKKSIQWSKYFGIDKKSKPIRNLTNKINSILDIDRLLENPIKMQEYFDPEEIEVMINKLKFIENYVINETLKYVGANQDITDPDDLTTFKDHVLSYLIIAYKVEKVRVILENLRRKFDENYSERNQIPIDYDEDSRYEEKLNKPVTVKRVKSNFDDNQPLLDDSEFLGSGLQKYFLNDLNNYNEEKNNEKLRNDLHLHNTVQKKRRNFATNGFEFVNDSNYMSDVNENDNNSLKNKSDIKEYCPLLDTVTKICHDITAIADNEYHQKLQSICNTHQICYFCNASLMACDLQYLYKIYNVCGYNNECRHAAKSILMILQDKRNTPLELKDCIQNSCICKIFDLKK